MLKRILGFVSFAMGTAIIGWFIYNQFWPTAEFRRHSRSVFQLAVPISMIWFGWRWMLDIGPGIETLQIDPDAPELLASVQKARCSMPRFLDAVRRHQDGAFVKFPLITDSGITEHIWGYVHHYEGGVFNVSLANTPVTGNDGVEGRRDLKETDVEDWQIVSPEGRIEGAWSLRALFEYADANRIHLNRTMRQQRTQLTAEAAESIPGDG